MKIFDLNLNSDYYYVKRDHIASKIPFGNRTFYGRFERIDEHIDDLIISQHLSKQYTYATALTQDNKTDYLLIEYKGCEYEKFYHLVKHLCKTQNIDNYQIYQGKTEDKIQLFIEVEQMGIQEAQETLEWLSSMLETRLDKQWKCLPSTSLPDEYNIFTLPYKKL